MAKALGPLLSLHASGTIGSAITFEDRGHYANVKAYKKQRYDVTPARQHHNACMALSNQFVRLIKARPTHMNSGPLPDAQALAATPPESRQWQQKISSWMLSNRGSNIMDTFYIYSFSTVHDREQWQNLAGRLWPGLIASEYIYIGNHYSYQEWINFQPEEYAYFWVKILSAFHILTTQDPSQL